MAVTGKFKGPKTQNNFPCIAPFLTLTERVLVPCLKNREKGLYAYCNLKNIYVKTK